MGDRDAGILLGEEMEGLSMGLLKIGGTYYISMDFSWSTRGVRHAYFSLFGTGTLSHPKNRRSTI